MNNIIDEKFFRKDKRFSKVIILFISIGILLRTFHYLYNRSLWMDEIYLSAGLLHMNFLELASEAMDYGQKAPIGFLWLVKLPMTLMGNSEMILRLVPYIAGIISLVLYAKVCRSFLKPTGQLIAVAILAFSPAMIYHTVEIKQYSTECLATIVALYLYIRYRDNSHWKENIAWGIFGAISLWFSFSVIFILAGIACGISLHHLLKKDWRHLFYNAVPFIMWLLSFVINYIFFTHKHAESDWVVYFFKTYDNFMPFPPESIAQLKWFPRNFIDMMDYPLGLVWNLKAFSGNVLIKLLAIPLLPIILFFKGLYALFNHKRRDFYALVFPVVFMLLASGIYLYPLLERFWVFIAPVFIIFIATGSEFLLNRIKTVSLATALLLLIIIGPVVQSAYSITHPQYFYKHKKSFERESLSYINDHFQSGDAVYNYWNNAPGFMVYKQIMPFKFTAVEGRDFRKLSGGLTDYNRNLAQDFTKFNGKKRVWVIYNTQFTTDIGDKVDDPLWYYKNKLSPAENLELQLNKIGKQVQKISRPDVTICLYELK